MTPAREVLLRQWDTARALLDHHLTDLTTEECLWRPAPVGLHLTREASGAWHGEWPTHEGYDLGPPSIGWTSWHLGLWLTLALDHTHSDARPTKDDVTWPGSGPDAARWIADLAHRWRADAEALPVEDWSSTERVRWPFADRSFAHLFAWSVVELTKNAAEIGQGRFLYAASRPQPASPAKAGVQIQAPTSPGEDRQCRISRRGALQSGPRPSPGTQIRDGKRTL